MDDDENFCTACGVRGGELYSKCLLPCPCGGGCVWRRRAQCRACHTPGLCDG